MHYVSNHSNAMDAHIVQQTVLQIKQQELAAVKNGQSVKYGAHLLGNTGVKNAHQNNGKEENC